MKAQNILETIGDTPHVRINRLYPSEYEVYVKVEKANPGGSIKDRIALSMVEDAEARGILKPDTVIIEPTSGNTGIGLALVASVKGYKLILTMPESMSIERRKILSIFGAQLELTPREKGMKGAIAKAEELAQTIDNSWIPSQFDNDANVEAHRKNTAREIVRDFPEGFDYLITGVGTGGHITGVAEVLKKKFPNMKVFAVEPGQSPVIGGGQPGPHPIQGIGAGFIPKIMNVDLLEGTITVSKDEAFEYTRKAAMLEGLFVGISSGASLAAVAKKIKELPAGSRILTFSYDTGERYLSVDGLF
ncbi:Cysteine synthase [hydrothermal vent metagenome]|uniref:Cysteine synthase n=1 Tax=hydrothermal vent metagenome TaxID=652676 RepID=A0A3B0TBB0_9ZZZZ